MPDAHLKRIASALHALHHLLLGHAAMLVHNAQIREGGGGSCTSVANSAAPASVLALHENEEERRYKPILVMMHGTRVVPRLT